MPKSIKKLRRLIEASWLTINPVSIILLPLSLIYRAVAFCRSYAYKKGFLTSYKVNAPVIVVGNISVGGTGKTPLVIYLTNELKAAGFKPGIISRGYGRENANEVTLVNSDTHVRQSGDEAWLIYSKTQVPVVLSADRVTAANVLLQKYDCNVIISDDGFQHLRLKRDFDIVVIDGSRGFGNGLCLPAGFLRESLTALNRADALVVNGNLDAKGQHKISPYNVVNMYLHIKQAVNLSDGATADLTTFNENKVNAVAGIGNPARFFNALKSQGLKLIEHDFADHHVFSEADINFKNNNVILMTEKDAVKCVDFSHELKQRIWVVPVFTEVNKHLIKWIIGKLRSVND